jgi:3-phenylpropionate/cinnamic acid dioxygenase small subunit
MSDDVHAIQNLIYSYAELLDTGDLEGLGRLFDRATLRTHGRPEALQGARAVQELMERAVQLYDGIPSTKHLITNVSVEVNGDRRSAKASSYYTALQARPELPLQPILAGRWHDRFERDGEQWRFADRLIYTDLVGDLRFHIKGLPQ